MGQGPDGLVVGSVQDGLGHGCSGLVVGDHQFQVELFGLGAFGVDRQDPRWADLTVASYAMGGAFLSRLNALLREDMASMGPVRARDCEDAQTQLVRLAKTLADRGDIMLVDPKSDDALIV